MAIYQHVLIATDLSEHSDALVNHAMKLAKPWGAKISIVHVVDYGPLIYGSGEFALPLDADIDQSLIKDAKAKLKEKGAQLGIQTQNQWVLHGQAKNEIVSLAEKIKADLLVVGGHDKRWLSLLFGSTANAILHHMPCDVLTVRLQETDATD